MRLVVLLVVLVFVQSMPQPEGPNKLLVSATREAKRGKPTKRPKRLYIITLCIQSSKPSKHSYTGLVRKKPKKLSYLLELSASKLGAQATPISTLVRRNTLSKLKLINYTNMRSTKEKNKCGWRKTTGTKLTHDRYMRNFSLNLLFLAQ